jgi:ribonuclease Y
MEILIVGAAAAVAAAVAWGMRGRQRVLQPAEKGLVEAPPGRRSRGEAHKGDGRSDGQTTPRQEAGPATETGVSDTAEELVRLRERLEQELAERRAEISRLEERILHREESLERRLLEVDSRERSLNERDLSLDKRSEELERAGEEHVRALEGVASLSRAQAKQALMNELEADARHDVARTVRQLEDEARRDATRKARNILSAAMQRLAAGHAAETTVSVVQLPSDDMKGRIIGREGRNIRALENITGVDFIIDDTPSAVVLSAFDGVRREIAKLTLEKLVQDGRIHPARIEEAFYQARSEIENHIVEQGEQALFEANVHAMHPELVKLLGRLKYRTSYGQNVLSHSIEVSRLAAMMADELGASAKTARRAALMHDLGKAVSHETDGPHALVGGELARRYGETEAVAHAMEAHHNEVEMQTVEAVIVQTADSLSGARPGARGESLEHYVKRLKDLEQVALRREGVDNVYAMQAGREIRVMVAPGAVSDDEAAMLSHEIARDIERELEYPGQIKVTVIRESRATDVAK